MKKIVSAIFISILLLTGCTQGDEDTKVEQVVKNEDGTISINHLRGELTLDKKPENVVTLSTTYAETMVALGEVPIGATTEMMDSSEFPQYIEAELNEAGTTSVGWQTTPDLEKVASLEPDLIFITPSIDELYDDLTLIAPTIEWEFNGKGSTTWDWRELLIDMGIIFEKEEKAQQIINEYDTRVENLNEKINTNMQEETVMYLRVMENEMRYYGIGKQGFLYEELSFAKPDDLPDAERSFEVISIEKLLEINPDHIILMVDQPEYLDKITTTNNLYQELSAVKNGNVYPVDYVIWQLGFGPLSSNLKLDNIEEFFLS